MDAGVKGVTFFFHPENPTSKVCFFHCEAGGITRCPEWTMQLDHILYSNTPLNREKVNLIHLSSFLIILEHYSNHLSNHTIQVVFWNLISYLPKRSTIVKVFFGGEGKGLLGGSSQFVSAINNHG